MPFLRLTRDRRGFENTFLLHSDRPGERPRLLYWYRTAPGILLGRAPLDEEAIRTIEEHHPEIEFDWPAILALGEAMMHEDEVPVKAERRGRQPRGRDREPSREREPRREPRQAPRPAPIEVDPELAAVVGELDQDGDTEEAAPAAEAPHTLHGLLEELVGREIATRLRARHSEICARIHERHSNPATRDAWLHRAESLDPEMWLSPEAILEGVRNADPLFDALRQELMES